METMTTLGVDPGSSHNGWAVFRDGKLLECGQINADGKQKWARRRPGLLAAFGRLLRQWQPDLVAIEKTQMGGGEERTAAQAFSQAANTRATEELAGEIMVMATKQGAACTRVTVQGGLKALGCKHGATDRQVAEAFGLMFGRKLLVKDHHEARAAGVAMRGEAQWKLEQAKGRVA